MVKEEASGLLRGYIFSTPFLLTDLLLSTRLVTCPLITNYWSRTKFSLKNLRKSILLRMAKMGRYKQHRSCQWHCFFHCEKGRSMVRENETYRVKQR